MKFESRQEDPKVTVGRVTALLGEGDDKKAVQRTLLRSRALFLRLGANCVLWFPLLEAL